MKNVLANLINPYTGFLFGFILMMALNIAVFRASTPTDAELREQIVRLRAEADRIEADLAKKGSNK